MGAVDSKYLLRYFTARCDPNNRSMRADVINIIFKFRTQNTDEIVLIPGLVNSTDPETKFDSSLTDALRSTLNTRELEINFNQKQSEHYDRPLE